MMDESSSGPPPMPPETAQIARWYAMRCDGCHWWDATHELGLSVVEGLCLYEPPDTCHPPKTKNRWRCRHWREAR